MAETETGAEQWRSIVARTRAGRLPTEPPATLPTWGWYEVHPVKSTNGGRLLYLYWRWRENGRRRGRCLGRIDL